jgi:hypothetical protein
MKTPQETFDEICSGLIKQGQKSYDCGCKYRDLKGNRCAVGQLVPNELYCEDMESFSVQDLVSSKYKKIANVLRQHNSRLLVALQVAHDASPPEGFIPAFKARARNIAEDWKLNTGVLDEFRDT